MYSSRPRYLALRNLAHSTSPILTMALHINLAQTLFRKLVTESVQNRWICGTFANTAPVCPQDRQSASHRGLESQRIGPREGYTQSSQAWGWKR